MACTSAKEKRFVAPGTSAAGVTWISSYVRVCAGSGVRCASSESTAFV